MNTIIVGLLYTGMISMLLYYYFCNLAGTKFQWYCGVMYAVLSCGFAICRHLGWTTEFLDICLGIMLLTGCGMLFQNIKFNESIGPSSLIISLYSIVVGMMQSVFFWIVASINSVIVLKFADLLQNAAVVVLLILISRMILRSFSSNMRPIRRQYLLMLLVPVLFITFFEAFISDFIYGNTIIWDTAKGLTFPSLNNFELLVLRLLACGGLFCALIIYQKLSDLIEHQQTIQLLQQQTQNQEIYIKEAKSRYEQTRSFRHDIKNHLLILHQLIKDGKPNEASEYLENMEVISEALSFHVQTGNAAADALLSNKLNVAAQQEISVHCAISIPKQSLIADMDWCIVLSNALDNAINASESLGGQDRWIRLSGSQKGNVYLLNIENRCREDTALPLEGIGLSNIRAVLKKYNGNMNVEITENIFKLNMLFIIPQHPKDIPQQTY